MQDDILSVCKILELQKKLAAKYPDSDYIKIETLLTMGNAALDFSKFRMVQAMRHLLNDCHGLMNINSNLKELKIGYAFILRNSSILFAEIGDIPQAVKIVEELIGLCSDNPDLLDVKEELARALSNAVTTILHRGRHLVPQNSLEKYSQILESLFLENQDSKKIKVAYSVAQSNLKKAGNSGPF